MEIYPKTTGNSPARPRIARESPPPSLQNFDETLGELRLVSRGDDFKSLKISKENYRSVERILDVGQEIFSAGQSANRFAGIHGHSLPKIHHDGRFKGDTGWKVNSCVKGANPSRADFTKSQCSDLKNSLRKPNRPAPRDSESSLHKDINPSPKSKPTKAKSKPQRIPPDPNPAP